MPRSGIARSYGNSVFSFFEELPYYFPYWLHQFTFPPTVGGGSLFSTLSPAFIICRHLNDGHSDWCELVPHCSLNLHLSNNCLMEHLSMCLLPICMSSLEISRFKASAKFLIVLFIFLLLNYMSFCTFWKVSPWAHHLQVFSPIS